MPKTPQARLLFALVVAVLVGSIGRNLYRRWLNNALISAVETKNVAAVRGLLDRGADPDTRRPDDNPTYPDHALLESVIYGRASGEASNTARLPPQQEIACLLIQHGADVRNDPQVSYRYLTDACGSGSIAVVRCLLEHGVNTRAPGERFETALQSALNYDLYAGLVTSPGGHAISAAEKAQCQRISREMTALLRQHGAQPTLLEAVQMHDDALLRQMLAEGADVNAKDAKNMSGQTALLVAVREDDLVLMRTLLDHGANPNLENQSYSFPLISASGYGRNESNLEAVRLLLDHGADVNAVGSNSGTALLTAIYNKHADIARLLLARGANPNRERTVDNYMGSALSAAATSLPELVPTLLAHHADINGDEGAPLKAALRADRPALAQYLLWMGAKVYPAVTKTVMKTLAASWGAKPQPTQITLPSTLQTAVTYCPECFDVLLRAGADIRPERADILLAAAGAGHAVLFDRLIALGANVNAVDAAGQTPLMLALEHAPDGVPTLLAHGANPNIVTRMAETPLLFAVGKGNVELVRLLLAHHADPNLKPPRSHTALYFARRHNMQPVIQLLEQAGARAE